MKGCDEGKPTPYLDGHPDRGDAPFRLPHSPERAAARPIVCGERRVLSCRSAVIPEPLGPDVLAFALLSAVRLSRFSAAQS
jgi:hypothetical protein